MKLLTMGLFKLNEKWTNGSGFMLILANTNLALRLVFGCRNVDKLELGRHICQRASRPEEVGAETAAEVALDRGPRHLRCTDYP